MNNPQPKISDYAVIGDGRTAALVSKTGSIDWCCFPIFDSPSCFARLLDSDGGFFCIRPVGSFESTQSYLDDTNVLETRFRTDEGAARLIDAFPVTSETEKKNRLVPDHEILRIVEGLEGIVRFRIHYAPRPHYGKPGTSARFGPWKRFGFSCSYDDNLLLLQSSIDYSRFRRTDRDAYSEFEVRAGERVIFSLTYAREAPAVIPALGDRALDRLEETIRYWKEWISQCRYRGEYDTLVRRSALVLKLLVFAPSGAVIAAPTSSLPEVIGGQRNWDYRYCWLRDASFTIRALVALGFAEEAGAFVSWMLHATQLTRPKLQVLYTVYGESKVKEKPLSWLRGHAGSTPVRIGNDAFKQFQIDIYGEVLDAFFQFSPFLGKIDGETRRFVLDIGQAIEGLWNQPDNGIWEVQSGPAHHTHSKALACVGLDCLVRLCKRYGWKAPVAKWRGTADQIRQNIENRGYSARLQSYTRIFDGDELDSSALVLPLVGYCDAHTPRMRRTCEAISHQLSENGLIYRYRPESDGLPDREGCFGICNFWLVENLAQAGDISGARRWMESILRWQNPANLWSEEIDPRTGEFLGNYPQSFTHIGLINAAVALNKVAESVGMMS